LSKRRFRLRPIVLQLFVNFCSLKVMLSFVAYAWYPA
jgi:hypothetical protein